MIDYIKTFLAMVGILAIIGAVQLTLERVEETPRTLDAVECTAHGHPIQPLNDSVLDGGEK